MCTEVNSVMGLQATAATKRKREITFDSKDANTTYTSGPPPRKNGKWSLNSNSNSNSSSNNNNNNNNNSNNNNNYIDVINGETNGNANGSGGDCKTAKAEQLLAIEGAKGLAATTTAINSSSNNNNNNINNNNNNNNDSGKKGACSSSNCIGNTLSAVAAKTSSINGIGKLVTSAGAATKSDNNDTPLSPALTAPVLEDSIAKLEVVAAAPCEPWSSAVASNTEPVVDCISKLQAVAVPSDPWGSIATRSTLATTLLSADELDDDDDDFEDDYEEDESIIPTYCPLRYNPFSTGVSSSSSMLHQQQQQQRQQNGSYSPVLGYGSRPNYYSEPFPQQNCSRTGSAQHMRLGGASVNGFTAAWQSTSVSSGGSQQFYVSHESAYAPPQLQPPPPQQQTTIRCAENGKSYMELGCSSPPTNLPPVTSVTIVPPPPPTAFGALHGPIGSAGVGLDVRHALKRCCDGRANWCSTGNANSNKNCYKEMRLKIRNLSMFKLSRFRQVSEQSLHRSVLICNTLKRIDREIEAEAKELHQAAAAAAAAAAQAQHMQYHQQQQMHVHLQNGGGGGASPLSHHNQAHLTQQAHQHPDYAPPVVNCARLAGIDYQLPLQQHGMSTVPQQSFQQQQQQQNYLGQPERLEPASAPQTPYHLQKSTSSSFSLSSSSVVHCDATSAPGTASSPSSSLPPYDHYPFRESQSGRATPFPCQPAMQIPPSAAASAATASSTATAAITTAATSTAANAISATVTTTGSTTLTESDSGYADEDSTRSINWSSVLSLSAQSALDPLNNNDLFSILPPVTSVTNPATAVPVPLTALGIGCSSTTGTTATDATTAAAATSNRNVSVTCNSTTTYVSTSSNNNNNNHNGSINISNNNNSSSSSSINVNTTAPPSQTSTTATFTTLSTISSATHSLTASYVSNMNAHAATSAAGNCSSTSGWEYGFLDMEFGLGAEFTELMPSCKLSSDDLFKSALTPVATSRYSSVVHDNELEQPAHIMVGS